MAVPYIARPFRRVKREGVFPREQIRLFHCLRCEAEPDSSDHKRRSEEDVFPSSLAGRGRDGLTRRAGEDRASLSVKQEVTDTCPVSRVHWRLRVDSDRRMIHRKGGTVQTLPVGTKAVSVDKLPVLQLKFDQVNVDRMSIFGEVGEIPRLSGADSWDLSDILIEVASVDKHTNRIASHGVLSFVEGEELRVADVL